MKDSSQGDRGSSQGLSDQRVNSGSVNVRGFSQGFFKGMQGLS